MLFRLTSLAVLLTSAFTAEAADGSYNYDETHIWDQVITSSPNECAGSSNSPIAIEDEGCTEFHSYVFENGSCTMADMKATVEKNGVKIGIKDGATCDKPYFILPGTTDKYTFAQMHIHLSSEHTIDGNYYAAELHMVHVGPKRYSVIGTMIQPDKPDDHPNFGPFIAAWQDARFDMESTCPAANQSCKVSKGYAKGDKLQFPTQQNMHPYKILASGQFYHYFGGLTTPPCTQAVWWNLNAKPMKVSVKQFAVLSEIILKTLDPSTECTKPLTVASVTGSTSRPPQPINGRVIKKICPGPTTTQNTSNPDAGTGGDQEPDSGAESTSYVVGALSFAAAVTAGQFL
jgi:carbonic anhydrase